MSNLRILGCVIGILGLIITFMIYRGQRWNKLNFILLSLVNASLITVCIDPDILNVLRDTLSFENEYRGRILALLIFSNLFLLFYVFLTRHKIEYMHFQFDRLVRSIGSKELQKSHELKDQIKPVMVLIPAYNEAENLKEVLPRIPKQVCGLGVGTLVVDDGSEDDTFQVSSKFSGVWVVRNPINRGGGAALRLGYDILKNAGACYCVTMDADGQHQPEQIEHLVKPLIEGHYDCVIGSRILGHREKDSRVRIAGVFFFGRLISILLGQTITDPSSGYRAFQTASVESLRLREDQYHTSELIIEGIKKGMQFTEVPITILRRKHGKSKKGKNVIYGLHFARIVAKTWWRK